MERHAQRGVQPDTAASYLGQVQGWHLRTHGVKLCGGVRLERLREMLRGLRRLHPSTRRLRRGVAPQKLAAAFAKLLDRRNPLHANVRALLAVMLQGLVRGAESGADGAFDPSRHPTREDVIVTQERLVWMMWPCKNMKHSGGKTVPLIIGAGGEFVDAVAEMNNLKRVDPVALGAESSTPLFRKPNGRPFKVEEIRDWVEKLMRAVGEEPSQFGAHSIRIGGATALFQAGADPCVIRTMGRWSSDCYRLYVRACFGQTLEWSRKAGSTTVSDVAGEFEEVDSY